MDPSAPSFILGIDKPKGITSHDVVCKVRKALHTKRVGHCGTLDPLATGVLPILVGSATRLSPYITSERKKYRAWISFGRSTTTDDSEGETIETKCVPRRLSDVDFAESALKGFLGKSKQIPPVFSAIKKNGKKSYEEARAGRILELDARDIEVFDMRLIGINTNIEDAIHESQIETTWVVDLDVSKGTYIRALARDIGIRVDVPAHISDLRRTASGSLEVSECARLSDVVESGELAIADPLRLLGFPICFVDEGQMSRVSNGLPIRTSGLEFLEPSTSGPACDCMSSTMHVAPLPEDGKNVCIACPSDSLSAICLYDGQEQQLHPKRVFLPPVMRFGDALYS